MKRIKRPVSIIGILLVLVLPLLAAGNGYLLLVMSLAGIYIVATTGLNILFGYSGQISFGHAAFYGIGAYSVGILAGLHGMPFWLSVLAGMVIAAVFAALIGWPSVRLVHHFLALVTIGIGEIVRLFFLNASSITNGFIGISRIPRPTIFGLSLSQPVPFLYLIMGIAIVGIVVQQSIRNSWWGRQLVAIKTNPMAAESFGSPLIRTRTIAFVLSAIYGAVAGSLYASLISYISPDTFTFNQSTLFMAMVLIGGAGTMLGPVLGVVVLTFLNQYVQQFEVYQNIVYGLLLVLVITFMPRGIVGAVADYYRDYIKPPEARGGRGAQIVETEEGQSE